MIDFDNGYFMFYSVALSERNVPSKITKRRISIGKKSYKIKHMCFWLARELRQRLYCNECIHHEALNALYIVLTQVLKEENSWSVQTSPSWNMAVSFIIDQIKQINMHGIGGKSKLNGSWQDVKTRLWPPKRHRW